MIAPLIQAFKTRPKQERIQIVTLLVATIVCAYGFWASTVWTEMFEVEKMANRKANRIETRLGKVEAPKFDVKISDAALEKKQKALLASTEKLKLLTQQFIPLADTGRLQQLKLNISELADGVKLDIKDFQVSKLSSKTQEELLEYDDFHGQYYQRPYFMIEAQSQFLGLLAFLKALSELDNLAVVKQLDVTYLGQGQLKIKMKILI